MVTGAIDFDARRPKGIVQVNVSEGYRLDGIVRCWAEAETSDARRQAEMAKGFMEAKQAVITKWPHPP